MALEFVDVQLRQGPRLFLRSLDVDINSDTTFESLLCCALSKCARVPTENVDEWAELPVTCTLHPNARRDMNTGMVMSDISRLVSARCKTSNERCVLFVIHQVEEIAAEVEKPRIVFGSKQHGQLMRGHLPDKRTGNLTIRHECFNRVVL